ncbi:hypothetical protein STCU_11262 [Strigomonas culicis]|uniref:Uncharacterized protein n=1 Tax=Strigomonas culicis TaxID=28005 RepID=S9UP13_9TRYP|nr:hypothetical protein STCU_11262 [Strigomonas culicis]|eukprot:EPY16431.1 hypothetical protein STCU_11262 [Strigomonas culicis]
MFAWTRSLRTVRVISCVLLENSLGHGASRSGAAPASVSNIQLNVTLQRDSVAQPFGLSFRKSGKRQELYVPLLRLPPYFTEQSAVLHTLFVTAPETHRLRRADTFLHLTSVNGLMGATAQLPDLKQLLRDELQLHLQVQLPPSLLVGKQALPARVRATRRPAAAVEEWEEEAAAPVRQRGRPSTKSLVDAVATAMAQKDAYRNKNAAANLNRRRRANDHKRRSTAALAAEDEDLTEDADDIISAYLSQKKKLQAAAPPARRPLKAQPQAALRKMRETAPVDVEEFDVDDAEVRAIAAAFERRRSKGAAVPPRARPAVRPAEDPEEMPWFRQMPKTSSKK